MRPGHREFIIEALDEPRTSTWRRRSWTLLAYVFLGLALAGAMVPLLPTTPFLLLTAACATRGSERLHRWLLEHPRFGPTLHQWEERQAIPLSGKILSFLGLAFAWTASARHLESPLAQGALALGLVAVSAYVWSRPLPEKRRS